MKNLSFFSIMPNWHGQAICPRDKPSKELLIIKMAAVGQKYKKVQNLTPKITFRPDNQIRSSDLDKIRPGHSMIDNRNKDVR